MRNTGLVLLAVGMILLLLGITNFAAAEQTAASGASDLGEFVTPDGHIDLDAIRRSGYEGAIDLNGAPLQLDPATGAPVVASAPDDIYWSSAFRLPGLDSDVRALAVYNGDLIAGGFFTSIDQIPMSHIARWDGSSWHALGLGTSGQVLALSVLGTVLVAGGSFDAAGGIASVGNIAAWDGSSWSALGTGVGNQVDALIVYGAN